MTRSRVTAIAAAAAVTSAAIVVVAAGPAAADRPRTGYPVRADGTAAGGWFGSRTAAKRAVFRIDPTAKPRTGGVQKGHWVSIFQGSGPVEIDRWRVRRAAWLVAKYGTYDSDAQAAAVEASLDHLLYGGRYRLTGRATERRLRQTGARDSILSLARYMLDASRDLAGPYRVRVGSPGAVVGGSLRLRVSVRTARTGRPVAHLPVTVRFDGRTRTGATDARGVMTTTAPAAVPGPRPVRVTVHRVPPDRLFLRHPVRRSGSRVVVAGRKTTLHRRSLVAVQATPRAWVTAPDQRTLGGAVPGSIHLVDGYPSQRTARLTLYGPFSPSETAACDPTRAVTTLTTPVTTDGTYPVPATSVDVAGVYRWGVSIPADAYNLAAGRCGQSVLLKAAPTLSVRATQTPVSRGERAYARVRAGALPDGFSHRAVVWLYGPFASRDAVRCTSDRQTRWRAVTITGPSSSARTAAVRLGSAGYFGWRAVLPATPLTVKATTRCRAPGTVLRVR